MKKRILALAVILALVAALVTPAVALAQVTQTVTGTTAGDYTITSTVAFETMPVSSEKTMADVVTASYDASVAVTVGDAGTGYLTDVLTKLEYLSSGPALEVTITAPVTDYVATDLPYTVTGSPIAMLDTETLALKAYTGTIPGTWQAVVITLTVT